MLLLLLTPLLLATSCSATCNSVNYRGETRLSINDILIEFGYFFLPGQNLSIVNNGIEFDLSDIVNENQTLYEYLFTTNVSNETTSYYFKVNNMECRFARNIFSVDSYTGPTEFALNVNYDDIRRVNFEWNSQQFDYIHLYCTRENDPLVVFRRIYFGSTVMASTDALEEVTTYTCHISGRTNDNAYALSENVTFTTRASPVFALSRVDIQQNLVQVSWQYTSAFDLFTVTAYKDCTGNGVSVNTTQLGSRTISGLTPGTLYCIDVTATRSSVTSLPTTIVVTTLEGVPSAVRNVRSAPIDSTSVLLSWEEPETPNGVLSYTVRVRGLEYDRDTTSFVIMDLEPCQSYSVSVRACTSASSGPWLFPVTVKTIVPIPEAPTIVIDQQNNELTWTLGVDTPPACEVIIHTIIITFQPVQSFEDDVIVSHNDRSGTTITIPRPSMLRVDVAYSVSARVQNSQGIISDSSSPPLILPPLNVGSSSRSYQRTNFTQVQFSGLQNCTTWNNTVSANHIRTALLNSLSYICPGNFIPSFQLNYPLTCIGNERFLFRFGYTQEPTFSQCLEYWYTSSSPHIQVGSRLLVADMSCDKLYISSLNDETCVPRDISCPSNSSGVAGGLIGGMLLGALIATAIITVTLLTCFRKKIAQRNTKKSGVGSCTVLDTVGIAEPTRNVYKKSKSAAHKQSSQSNEDNYEMVPYQGEEPSGSQYVEMSSNVKPSKKQTAYSDPEYEVPNAHITDHQKASVLQKESSHYEPFELDSDVTADVTPVANTKVQPITAQKKATTLPSNLPSASRPALVTDSTPKQAMTSSKTPAKPFGKMPLLPTKTPATAKKKPEAPKKKTSLGAKASLTGGATNTGSSVALKAQMFQQTPLDNIGLQQPPKPKPKPKGKAANEIPCADNKAYELWKAANK